MKIYLSGRIIGDQNNKERFSAAEREEQLKGNIVINPTVLPAGLGKADYMRIRFAMVDASNIVSFLPGWSGSDSAKLEMDYCKKTGKKIKYAKNQIEEGINYDTAGRCPRCMEDSKVIDSRECKNGSVLRTRICKFCGTKYQTLERLTKVIN